MSRFEVGAPRPVDVRDLTARHSPSLTGGMRGFGFALAMVLASTPFFVSGALPGIVGVVLALFVALRGVSSFLNERGTKLCDLANEQLAMGQPEVAGEILGVAIRRNPLPAVRRHAALVRAQVALACGDLVLCNKEATASLLTSGRPDGSASVRHLAALSLQAFALAALGKAKSARRAIRATREGAAKLDFEAVVAGGERSLTEPLARVALAEAVLCARKADRTALREHLRTHRRSILDGAGPRDRALFRSLERMSRADAASPYRMSERLDPPSSRGGLAPVDWVERILPNLRAFVVRTRGSANTGTFTPITGPGGEDGARAPLIQGAREFKGEGLYALAFVLGALAVGRTLFFSASSVQHGEGWRTFIMTLIGGAIIGVVTNLFYKHTRAVETRRFMEKAYQAFAEGKQERSQAILAAIPQDAAPVYRARAELSLAEAASRRGDFSEALTHAEDGLLLLGRGDEMTATLEPLLITERATALAALGKTRDALSLVATLPEVFTGRARAIFRVELHVLLANNELARAAALAASRSPFLPIDERTELLADLVCATFGEGAGSLETQRLHADLEHEDERAFVSSVSPALLEAFEPAPPKAPDLKPIEAAAPPAVTVCAPTEQATPTQMRFLAPNDAACATEVEAETEMEAEANADRVAPKTAGPSSA